jgi:hypothetical protein
MPRALYALLTIAAVWAINPAAAAIRESAFCIKGCDYGGGRGDCIFATYQQCVATASGRDASCAANPYFNANTDLTPNAPRLSRRRF